MTTRAKLIQEQVFLKKNERLAMLTRDEQIILLRALEVASEQEASPISKRQFAGISRKLASFIVDSE